jgi:hypothetical protein
MKLRWIATAALALTVSAALPTVAQADDYRGRDRYEDARHRDRYERDRGYDRLDHHRHDHDRGHVRYQREFDVDIPLREVPRNVMETANYERRGYRIEAVQHVFRDGKFFYRFRIDDPGRRDRDMNIRIAANGRLLTVEEAGDVRYVHHHHRH